jgi:FHA domain-containing protein
MSEVTLDLVSMDSAPLAVERSCRFDGLGGTIGRDEGNTLVLQDKHRRVSRLHASVTFPDGLPTITNASTSLPVTIGERVLDCGQKASLLAGDLLEIGPYVLKVRALPESADVDVPVCVALPEGVAGNAMETTDLTAVMSPAPSLQPALAEVSQPIVPGVSVHAQPSVLTEGSRVGPVVDSLDPFADLFAGIGPASPGPSAGGDVRTAPEITGHLPASEVYPKDADPFASLLNAYESNPEPKLGVGRSDEVSAAPGVPLEMRRDSMATAPEFVTHSHARPLQGLIPEDFNPFDLPSSTSRNSADPLGELLYGGAKQSSEAVNPVEPSIDALFSSGGGSPFDGLSLPPRSEGYVSSGLDILSVSADSCDPLMMFGGQLSSSDDFMRQPMRDDLPELGGAYQPPKSFVASSSSAFSNFGNSLQGTPQLMPSTDSAASPGALTEAFLKGAGLAPSVLPGGLTPELMSMIGSVLRAATSGAIDMLTARAATKLEVQASVTIISTQSNNPLKFLPNADVALQQMFGKKIPGFMRADDAMRDAFNDLRAHEIGVIAGTRAALTEVLGKFDPSVLGDRLAGGSLLDSLLPSIRKTKLWDIYLERYARIRQEAEDDFQSVFGRSFLQAYERETARVKAQTTESGK